MQSGFEAIDELHPEATAVFLDFDGTLVEIVDDPDAVQISRNALHQLASHLQGMSGALAIVSGRELAAIDAFTAPHIFPASGIHGFERRLTDEADAVQYLDVNVDALERVKAKLSEFADQETGLLVETKPAAVALHYRRRPELEGACRSAVQSALGSETGLRLLSGKCVFEIKAHAGDKGQAIAAFMDTKPFAGRTPVFIGDDVTDEAAFAVVNDTGGISIKVGDGDTLARYRLPNPAAVHEWLRRLAQHFQHDASGDAAT